jgi:hypothetical protein
MTHVFASLTGEHFLLDAAAVQAAPAVAARVLELERLVLALTKRLDEHAAALAPDPPTPPALAPAAPTFSRAAAAAAPPTGT